MKTIEIRELSADQISDELIKYKREQLNLRFQRSSGQNDKKQNLFQGLVHNG